MGQRQQRPLIIDKYENGLRRQMCYFVVTTMCVFIL
jgi:hypothetical protein